MTDHIPPQPKSSVRVVLELFKPEKRLDNVLLTALRAQKEDINLKNITRMAYKELFASGKILIKGQRAKPSSGVAKGTTYVDVLK